MFHLFGVFVFTLVAAVALPGSAAAQQSDAELPVVIKPQERRAKFRALRGMLADSRKVTARTRETIGRVRQRAETAIPRGEEPITEEQLEELTVEIDALERTLRRLTTELLGNDQLDAALQTNRAAEAVPKARDVVVKLDGDQDGAELEENLSAIEGQLDQVDQSLGSVVIPAPPE